jgi:predicted naringenin-chalcone synthase
LVLCSATAVALRPVAADFVILASPSDGVALSHTAAVVVAPVAPDANAVAGARDAETAVGVLRSDSLDAVLLLWLFYIYIFIVLHAPLL